MYLRNLRIRLSTSDGMYGTDIKFPNGLFVLWADNSMGKSTCLRSILVALGFEAMLTTQKELPLPPAMKSELDTENGIVKVLESEIYLEIENDRNESIVLHRTVKGTRNSDLIQVIFGAALSYPKSTYLTKDFFVSRPGSATREHGFHHFLANFFNWQLPMVSTYDDRQYPLYLQCIFPYFFVEQTRGWATIEPPIPSHFRIREVHSRVVEFILNLDAYAIAELKTKLERDLAEIKKQWNTNVSEIKILADTIQALPNNIPNLPIGIWPPDPFPTLIFPSEDGWVSISEKIKYLNIEIAKISEHEIPRVNEITESAQKELNELVERISERESILFKLVDIIEMDRAELISVVDRLNKIDEDLQRNKDIKTLLNLGSTNQLKVSNHRCPTCNQEIVDSLTPIAEKQEVMSVDENIAFLKDQQQTFKLVQLSIEKLIESREKQISWNREKLTEERRHLRTLKQTLNSDGRLPSKAILERQILLESELESVENSVEKFENLISKLEELSSIWQSVNSNKNQLPKNNISESDLRKLKLWSKTFVNQLRNYDFKSLPTETLSISIDNYRPIHEGFDLPNNISASDFIRVIWAYLASMLEISNQIESNHLGLLVFDEPKQQSAKELSFAQLFRQVSKISLDNKQVIFATSEKKKDLTQLLANIPHTINVIDGRIIKKI